MVRLQVEGMSCGHCAAAIKRAIAGVDPTAEVEVDLNAREVRVDGTSDQALLATAIRDAGYQPIEAR